MPNQGGAATTVRLVPLRKLPASFDEAAVQVLKEAFWDYPAWSLLGCQDSEALQAMMTSFHRAMINYHRNSCYVLLRDVTDEDLEGGNFSPDAVIGHCGGWRSHDVTETETTVGWLWHGLYRFPFMHGVGWTRRLLALGDAIHDTDVQCGRRSGPQRWLIEYVGVARAWAHQGHGRRMLNLLMETLAEEDPGLGFDLFTHTEGNVAFYKTLGFETAGETQDLRANGLSCTQWNMAKAAMGGHE